MSGIEIAGIVLAVIPLFIAAAEHLQGSTKTKKAIKDGVFASSYKVKLIQQQTLLGLYVKSVAGRTSLPSRTQAALVEKPNGDAWQRLEVIKAISLELGDAHQSFVELLKRVSTALARSVRVEQQGKESEADIVRRPEFYVKYGFSKSFSLGRYAERPLA